MVVLGFTVTFVCRRQVPNTCRPPTAIARAVSSLVWAWGLAAKPQIGALGGCVLTCGLQPQP
jgi:hypothetical protein